MARHRRHVRREDDINQRKQNVNFPNFDISSIASIINSININDIIQSVSSMGAVAETIANNGGSNEDIDEAMKDPNFRKSEIMRSIRTLITADKSEILQVAIQLYAASKNQNK